MFSFFRATKRGLLLGLAPLVFQVFSVGNLPAIGPLPAASFSLLSSEAAQSLNEQRILSMSRVKVETILIFHF
jgi:hypothetical protein